MTGIERGHLQEVNARGTTGTVVTVEINTLTAIDDGRVVGEMVYEFGWHILGNEQSCKQRLIRTV